MNRLEFSKSDALHQQTEVSQRLQAAVVTVVLVAIALYGFPYLAYETTIKRTMYEFGTSLIPTRFINTLQKSATSISGRPGAFGQRKTASSQNNATAIQQIYNVSGVSSVVQRARSLSGIDKLVPKAKEVSFSGLGNWDNSCYQNSVLQGLASLPAFKIFVERSWLMFVRAGIEAGTHKALDVFLNQLQEQVHTRRTLWPPSILKSMNTWQQQDAQEYLSKIMDAVDREAVRYHQIMARRLTPGLASLRFHNLGEQQAEGAILQQDTDETLHRTGETLLPRNPLDGTLSQVLRCQRCGFSEGLSLVPCNCLTLNLGLGGHCYLEDLLNAYTDPEMIEGVECEECTRMANGEASDSEQSSTSQAGDETTSSRKSSRKPKVLSTKAKQILFGRLPRDLLIHVNRSIFDDWGNQRKNTSLINFPPVLKIVEDWVASIGEPVSGRHGSYELKCTVTHSGRHDNGHYIAYGKRGKEWYSFNDEVVTKTSEEQVLERGNVFLLFYELIDQKPILEVNVPGQADGDSFSRSISSAEGQAGVDTQTQNEPSAGHE